MSSQGQKGGNPYGNPYGQSMYQSNGSMPDYGGSYFSLGNSRRMPYGNPNFTPGVNPFASNPKPGVAPNPFAANPGYNPFGNSGFDQQQGVPPNPFAPSSTPFGSSNFGSTSSVTPTNPYAPTGNPFGGNSGFGGAQGSAQAGGSGAFPTNPGNVDPNSPEYAAYYNSLPASTRLYLAAPGSAQANFKYNDYMASLANPNAAHF